MPMVQVYTNLPASRVPENFVATTVEVVAKTMGKPPERVLLHLNCDQVMQAVGTSDPVVYTTISAIGKISPSENIAHSSALAAHYGTSLGIPPNRVYIKFEDVAPHCIGHEGTTMAAK